MVSAHHAHHGARAVQWEKRGRAGGRGEGRMGSRQERRRVRRGLRVRVSPPLGSRSPGHPASPFMQCVQSGRERGAVRAAGHSARAVKTRRSGIPPPIRPAHSPNLPHARAWERESQREHAHLGLPLGTGEEGRKNRVEGPHTSPLFSCLHPFTPSSTSSLPRPPWPPPSAPAPWSSPRPPAPRLPPRRRPRRPR